MYDECGVRAGARGRGKARVTYGKDVVRVRVGIKLGIKVRVRVTPDSRRWGKLGGKCSHLHPEDTARVAKSIGYITIIYWVRVKAYIVRHKHIICVSDRPPLQSHGV